MRQWVTQAGINKKEATAIIGVPEKAAAKRCGVGGKSLPQVLLLLTCKDLLPLVRADTNVTLQRQPCSDSLQPYHFPCLFHN